MREKKISQKKFCNTLNKCAINYSVVPATIRENRTERSLALPQIIPGFIRPASLIMFWFHGVFLRRRLSPDWKKAKVSSSI